MHYNLLKYIKFNMPNFLQNCPCKDKKDKNKKDLRWSLRLTLVSLCGNVCESSKSIPLLINKRIVVQIILLWGWTREVQTWKGIRIIQGIFIERVLCLEYISVVPAFRELAISWERQVFMQMIIMQLYIVGYFCAP